MLNSTDIEKDVKCEIEKHNSWAESWRREGVWCSTQRLVAGQMLRDESMMTHTGDSRAETKENLVSNPDRNLDVSQVWSWRCQSRVP